MENQCKFVECLRKPYRMEFCRVHYDQLLNADFDETVLTPILTLRPGQSKTTNTVCLFEECGRDSFCRGYCRRHYRNFVKAGYDASKLKPIGRSGRFDPRHEVPEGLKYCPACKEAKLPETFANGSFCPPCRQERMWLHNYGLSKEEVLKMLVAQDSLCRICDIDIQDCFVVDHCHNSSTVRGLLCDACNKGLGFFRDNTESLASAIAYLNEANDAGQ